jgi:hypothetical protein
VSICMRREFLIGNLTTIVTALNLFRGQNAELHAYNGFDVRGRLLETGRHSVLEVETVYHIPEYRAYVVEFDADKSTLSPEINNITLILKEIFLKYSTGDVKPVICSTEYKKLFDYTFPDQPEGSQQDAMEFIMMVLLGIVENVPTISQRSICDQ